MVNVVGSFGVVLLMIILRLELVEKAFIDCVICMFLSMTIVYVVLGNSGLLFLG